MEGRRFGLISDTHDDRVDWTAAVAGIREALGPVDAILHCGDFCTPKALEALAAIAPVLAVRNAMTDPPADPPVLVNGPRIVEAGGMEIGMVFSLSTAPVQAETDPVLGFPNLNAADAVRLLFGGRIDVCVFGGTHRPAIASSAGTLFINPGSPTLSNTRTVALLTIDGGTASVEIRPVV